MPPQRQGKEGQRLLQLWNQLHLKDGVLCCRLPGKLRSELCDKIVIPSCLRQETLQEIHEGIVGGHLGFEKTLEKVKECFYWPGQYKDVQEWCQTCAICAARKTPTPKPKAALQQVSVGYPMELVAIDILGPLPQSETGNIYILVVGDYFTKWKEAYPIPPTRRQKLLQRN